jgi:sec-independent protein translocase protein TatA
MPGFIGVPELLLLGLVALLLFGPKRLPEMGRGLGKGMREFKDSVTGITDMSPTPAAVESNTVESTTVESKQIEPAPRPETEL